MKKSYIYSIAVIVACCSLVAVFFGGTGVATPDHESEIYEMFEKAIKTAEEGNEFLKISSNPYDFCNDNPDFDKIVDMGYSILPQLKGILEPGDKIGLSGYMVCVAIEKIVDTDLKTFEEFAWGTANGFNRAFDNFVKRMPGMVNGILESDKDDSVKAEELKKLGVLAVPYVLEHKKCNAEIIEVMGGMLGNAETVQNKDEFLNKNKVDLEMIKTFCNSIK